MTREQRLQSYKIARNNIAKHRNQGICFALSRAELVVLGKSDFANHDWMKRYFPECALFDPSPGTAHWWFGNPLYGGKKERLIVLDFCIAMLKKTLSPKTPSI